MRSRRNWLALAVPAALAALVFAVPASASAPFAATAPHVNGVVRIVHRGLVKDCEYIKNLDSGEEIEDYGAGEPTSTVKPPGSCFNLYNEFHYSTGGKTYTGYEYQDTSGHCLWDNNGQIYLTTACLAGHPREEFYGITYYSGVGWLFGDVEEGPTWEMEQAYCPTYSSGTVIMVKAGTGECIYWNFPGN
jgi:hypothetical protein